MMAAPCMGDTTSAISGSAKQAEARQPAFREPQQDDGRHGGEIEKRGGDHRSLVESRR